MKQKVYTKYHLPALMEIANALFDSELYHAFRQDENGKWQAKEKLSFLPVQQEAELYLPKSEFDIRDGKWLGRSVYFYTNLEAQDMVEQFLHPYLSRLCQCFRIEAERYDDAILDDSIDDDLICQLVSGVWWLKLIQQERLMEIKKDAKVPTHVPDSNDTWYVWIDGRLEQGTLDYVVSEYIKDSFYFPFHMVDSNHTDYQDHEHEFDAILMDILQDPQHFSLQGCEDSYSQQEIRIMQKLQQKLLTDQPANFPKCTKS